MPDSPPRVAIPDLPALAPSTAGASVVTMDGEYRTLTAAQACTALARTAHIICHRTLTARRLCTGKQGRVHPESADILELFAFVHPARFCAPTPHGLARAMEIPVPADATDAALLHPAAQALLTHLAQANDADADRDWMARLAAAMERGGWAWGPAVLAALDRSGAGGADGQNTGVKAGAHGFNIWELLPAWKETPQRNAGQADEITPADAADRLHMLLAAGAEARPRQAEYTRTAAAAFAPRKDGGAGHTVLAEAGAGSGKTLGYLAAASLWAERSGGTAWLSTYTRNLQRQVDQELQRVFPDPQERARKVAVRKGRENYLCLLKLQDLVQAAAAGMGDAVTAGLVARWARHSRDGDMVGGDFPSWLPGGGRLAATLTDKPGECLHTACAHYRKCFIESSIRRARRASIVVANHALVLARAQAAHEGGETADLPRRYVFDEGHHLFDAADSAFAAHVTAREASDMRRRLLGADTRPARDRPARRERALVARLETLASGNDAAETALENVRRLAAELPATGWQARLAGTGAAGAAGTAERFFAQARAHVLAQASARERDGPYGLEALLTPDAADLCRDARTFSGSMEALRAALQILDGRLEQRLRADTRPEAQAVDEDTRARFEAARRSLEHYARVILPDWRDMLDHVASGEVPESGAPEEFVHLFRLDRRDGREEDVGLHRHVLDPARPLAERTLEPADGVLITSATLQDRPAADDDDAADWQTAEVRTGVRHLPAPAARRRFDAPFDYAAQAQVFIVQDVRHDDDASVASACRELFCASGGGALGLFTAIRRLRAVHGRICAPLHAHGLTVFAQHVDPLDTGTLTDVFRAEEDSCLLGTNALRDGVDVPGRSLRLVVMDRTPWPRPDILHRARRAHFGGRIYDDMVTRLRLRQAFGRLIRTAQDRGAFVLLDARMPARLMDAFPPEAAVTRAPLADVAEQVRARLGSPQA